MRLLVYGAGNIGSVYAALLKESGQDVSILARGKRLADIRAHGIRLENVVTRQQTATRVEAVERLHADDDYDLVLVALPGNRVPDVLPMLAANRRVPSVMFFGNNAGGFRQAIEAIGRDRVLLGFPGAAAVPDGDRISFLITSQQEQPTTIGELDGTRSARIEALRAALTAAGFSAAICSNMDAWLKTHVAEVSPTANALYMVGGDPGRLARTRDALLLMLRSIREGYRALGAHGIPITPANHRIFAWLPEPLLLLAMRRMLRSETAGTKLGHALAAREECQRLADDLRALIAEASIPAPASDRLYAHLDPAAKPIADGSADLRLKWGGVWAIGTAFLALAVLPATIWRFGATGAGR